jgi:predicted SprT family Zn-dependent metalloprotease
MAIATPLPLEIKELFEIVFNDAKRLSFNLLEENLNRITLGVKDMKPWGKCYHLRSSISNGRFQIYLSKRLLSSKNNVAIKNTIMHEIIHTCAGAFNHGREFKRLGAIAGEMGYTITRLTSVKSVFGDKPITEIDMGEKYILKCKDCGHEYKFNRLSKYVKYPDRCRCSHCEGKLERIK